jgi:uncharacterized protein (DUF433 family)
VEEATVPNSVIIKVPEVLGGTPVFANTRVPFDALLDYVEGGKTLDEFLDDFPTVTREAAIAAGFAGRVHPAEAEGSLGGARMSNRIGSRMGG